MERVLEVYKRPYDEKIPVLCMDEKPIQLLQDKTAPLPGTQKHPKRIDHEYKRIGTASIFLFTEPLAGWRYAYAREQRTMVDWAKQVAAIIDSRYPNNEKIILVCDNLNIHEPGSFYKAFKPSKAREYVRKIEFCHTPKHGSWLNIAECELSSLEKQCLRFRRFDNVDYLNAEMLAWHSDVNSKQKGVDWQFTVEDARTKLKSLYPKIIL